jgi:hypothetical protein
MSFQIEYLNRLEGDLRNASTRQTPSRRGRALAPRALLVAAAVVLMGGSLALAFGGRVLTVLDSGPVPHVVNSRLHQLVAGPLELPRDGAPPQPKSLPADRIVSGSQRRLLTVRTSRGHIASLYVARTRRGLMCVVSVGWPFGMGACANDKPVEGPFSSLGTGATTRSRDGKHVSLIRTIVGRAAGSRAHTVRVVYADGTHDDIAVVQGWFMFEVPAAHMTPTTATVRLDVLSANGTRLGSLADPFDLKRVRPHFTKPVPSSIRVLARAQLPNGGGTVSISSGRDAAGRNCFRHLRNGKSQQFPVWECTGQVGHSSYLPYPSGERPKLVPLRWQMGLRNDSRYPTGYGYAYATGWVTPQVTRLTVRYQDGGAADIPLHGRYYVYVVPPAHWPAGRRPRILEERDATGGLVYRQFLYPRQHCIYPGRDPLCVNLAMGTG